MALDFPASPTNGQVFEQYIYDTSIPGWRNQNSSEGIGLQYKSALVPVVPTSVSVSSGSATVGANGEVVFTGATNISLNGVFTSAFENYHVVFSNHVPSSGGSNMSWVLRSNGSDATTGIYTWYGMRWMSWTQAYIAGSNATSWYFMESIGQNNAKYSGFMEIQSPANNANQTRYTSHAHMAGDSYYGTALAAGTTGTANTAAYDGMTMYGSGAQNGRIQIYGYRK